MSFAAEAVARRIATVPRAVISQTTVASRTVMVGIEGPRAFTTTTVAQKTAVDTAKDGLKGVDRAVSDKLVDGINIGQTVAQKVKEASEDLLNTKTSGKAAELRGEMSGKAAELKGDAKGKAAEASGKVKGMASEVEKKM